MKLEKEEIQKSVLDFYKDIAIGKEKVKKDVNDLAKSFGYSNEELKSIPKEANLGLGCGNPQEKSKAKESEVVVDLGCGKGMDAFLARKYCKETGYVIGVDMTLDMITVARKIAKKKKYKNVEFRLGEIEHLPIADNIADLVISNCVINLSTDKKQVYKEIFRILKPGGRISISDTTLYKHLPESVISDPKMYGTWIAGALTLDELKEILKEVGFIDLDIDIKEISDQYRDKWGIKEVDLKEYLRKTITVAYKPIK